MNGEVTKSVPRTALTIASSQRDTISKPEGQTFWIKHLVGHNSLDIMLTLIFYNVGIKNDKWNLRERWGVTCLCMYINRTFACMWYIHIYICLYICIYTNLYPQAHLDSQCNWRIFWTILRKVVNINKHTSLHESRRKVELDFSLY